MSSKKKVSPKEVEVVETEPEVVEEEIKDVEITEAEEVQEEQPKKKSFIKRWWPALLGIGVAIGAFVAGRASGSSDEVALAKLEHEYGNGDNMDDESDNSGESETEKPQEDNIEETKEDS